MTDKIPCFLLRALLSEVQTTPPDCYAGTAGHVRGIVVHFGKLADRFYTSNLQQ